MTPYDRALLDFKEAVKAFSKASYRVTGAWEILEQVSGERGMFTEEYPFNESFDDVAIAIARWSNEVNGQGRSVLDWYPR